MSTIEQPKRMESYEKFFGLDEPPFSLAPNPRFVFESASHAAVFGQIAYALERREPLVVVTGEIGAGKTLLCRTVVQRLQRKTFLSIISDPQLDGDDLLKQLLEDFGLISKDRSKRADTSRHDLFQTLRDFLVSLVPLQAHAVVIIDEAQHARPDVLEQVRLLSNIDDERGTLLQIILVGQTDLEPLLSRPELRQLQQRVSRRLRLDPLDAGEVQQYIEHRLAVARGGSAPSPAGSDLEREVARWAKTTTAVTFAPEAAQAIARISGGLPRVINLLCDRALEGAFAARSHRIDVPAIESAAAALGLRQTSPPPLPPLPPPPPRPPSVTIPAAAPAAGDSVLRPLAPPIPPARPAPPPARLDRLEVVAQTTERVVATVSRTVTPPERTAVRGPRAPEPSVPVAFSERSEPEEEPSNRRWILIGVGILLAVLAIWFGLVMLTGPGEPQSATPPAATTPAPAPAAPPPAAASPSDPGTPAPAPAAGADGPAKPDPAPEPPPAPAPAESPDLSTAGSFEIVVASFRTEGRASSVASEVTTLGLPVRRRVSDGWQQVVAGPFASREEAAQAQQRLDRAGVTGTQIVPGRR